MKRQRLPADRIRCGLARDPLRRGLLLRSLVKAFGTLASRTLFQWTLVPRTLISPACAHHEAAISREGEGLELNFHRWLGPGCGQPGREPAPEPEPIEDVACHEKRRRQHA